MNTQTTGPSHSTPTFVFAPHSGLDPSQGPFPTTSTADLPHGPTMASATGHTPTSKVAGSRRKVPPSDPKGKGKRKLEEISDTEPSGSDEESEPSKAKNAHGGRRPGAGNYQDADLKQLLRLVEEELPVGGNGWKRIAARFAQWASRQGRPTRDAKALDTKFKMVGYIFSFPFRC
jgi:hypothetical protein